MWVLTQRDQSSGLWRGSEAMGVVGIYGCLKGAAFDGGRVLPEFCWRWECRSLVISQFCVSLALRALVEGRGAGIK
eukprot:scaffold145688_cov33-Cyclotella_meneghiniana.AAC.2